MNLDRAHIAVLVMMADEFLRKERHPVIQNLAESIRAQANERLTVPMSKLERAYLDTLRQQNA